MSTNIFCPLCETANFPDRITCRECGSTLMEYPQGDEDRITIRLHGSEEHRQEMTDRICAYMAELAALLSGEWGNDHWGFKLESTMEPDL
jgi:hypothetical protein